MKALPSKAYKWGRGHKAAFYAAEAAGRGSRKAYDAAQRGARKAPRVVAQAAERSVERGSQDVVTGSVNLAAYSFLHLIVVFGAGSLAVTTVVSHVTDRALDTGAGFLPGWARILGFALPKALTAGDSDNDDVDMGDKGAPAQEGDTFTRFDGGQVSINSGWGPRNTGIPGASRFHRGVDLPLEMGYPLFAWTDSTVTCSSSAGFGPNGLATIKTPQGTFQAGHLSQCADGSYRKGDSFGRVGNGGVSSGPHLHWGQKNAVGALVLPQRNPIQAVLTGQWPGGVASVGAGEINLNFIKELEGYHSCAYADGAQWSWGYGTKAPGAGHCTTEAQAHQDMVAYIGEHCLPLFDGRGLSGNQLTAAVSFCYNTGPGMAGWSIYGQMQPDGNPNFLGYTKATTGASLAPRRRKEQAMWNGQ